MTGDNAPHAGYFTDRLEAIDPEVADALKGELRRQQDGIELIASENIVSMATLDALASPIVNKTVEGYPGRRYYGGAEFADRVESLAIERASDRPPRRNTAMTCRATARAISSQASRCRL